MSSPLCEDKEEKSSTHVIAKLPVKRIIEFQDMEHLHEERAIKASGKQAPTRLPAERGASGSDLPFA